MYLFLRINIKGEFKQTQQKKTRKAGGCLLSSLVLNSLAYD